MNSIAVLYAILTPGSGTWPPSMKLIASPAVKCVAISLVELV